MQDFFSLLRKFHLPPDLHSFVFESNFRFRNSSIEEDEINYLMQSHTHLHYFSMRLSQYPDSWIHASRCQTRHGFGDAVTLNLEIF
jgi:hypothetical protein